MSQAQPTDWREKYLDLAEHQESLQQQFDEQLEQLRRALVRISLAADGADPELDKVLAALREHLKSPEKQNQLYKRLAVVEEVIIAFDERKTLSQERLQQVLHTLVEQLLRINDDRTIAKTLKALNRNIKSRINNQQELPQLLQELADLQAAILNVDEDNKPGFIQKWLGSREKATDDKINKTISEPENEADVGDIDGLNPDIITELNNIVDLLGSSGVDAAVTKQLKQQLQHANSIQHLHYLLQELRLALDTAVQRTKKEFGEFLQKTNSQLLDISQILNHANKLAREQSEQQNQLYTAVGDHIQSLQSSVEQASDLEHLKQEVSNQLQHIRDKIAQAEQKPNSLSGQLKELLDKVEQFEKDAQTTTKILKQQQHKAETDTLTGLPNREAYEQRLQLELARWQRYNNPLTLAVLDIDHFKRINDSYGHQAGDRVLKLIAQSLLRNLRETDFIGRYGGEEFAILLPETDTKQAEVVLNKIRETIATTPFHFRKQPVQITLSVGFSEFKGADTDKVVFARADKALYQAKNQGRNCCRSN